MSDYENLPFRLSDAGLNLHMANDLVKDSQWVKLVNVQPTYEGSIGTRVGRVMEFDTGSGTAVHTIKRVGDDTVLVGSGTSLYRNVTPFPTSGYSGDPLHLVVYRPNLSSSVWTYVGDTEQLRKVKEDGTDYKWGISPPAEPCIASILTPGLLNSAVSGAINYDWRYTYYSKITGAESNPSPIMGTRVAAVNQVASISVSASTDPQVDTIRVWRRGGVFPETWLLVSTGPNTDGYITDNNADADLLFAQPVDLDNDVPFTTVDENGHALVETPLPYVFGPFIGRYIIATGDPNRPGYAYWTNNDRPDTSGTANNVEVCKPTEPLLSGFIYGGNPYIWTRDNLYTLDFGGPTAIPTFTPRKMPVGRGIPGPYAFAVGPLIWYVSQDGIYATDGQSPGGSISEMSIRTIFKDITAGGIPPIDFTQANAIKLSYSNLILHLFYIGTDGSNVHLVYHTQYQRWRQEVISGFNELIAYQDENQVTSDTLTGGDNGKIYLISGTDDDGAAISCEARTGSLDFGMSQTLKELGNIILDADPQGGTITITPYKDAETSSLTPVTSTGTGRQKLVNSLSDSYVYSVAFNLGWSGPAALYQFSLLWRPDEEYLAHWEFPETGHGMPGWQMLRDMYLVVRSTSDLVFSIFVDGVLHTYTVPSTGGERRKQHVWLDPVKGKVFRYMLDGAAPFAIYGDDCEVRAKTWNTSLGYQLVSPFRAHPRNAYSPEKGPSSV